MDTRLRGYDDLGAYALFGWRTDAIRKPVGWLWRQAGAHSRLPQSAFVVAALMQGWQCARPINREHVGQASRTPGGPAQVAAFLARTVGVHTGWLTRSRFAV